MIRLSNLTRGKRQLTLTSHNIETNSSELIKKTLVMNSINYVTDDHSLLQFCECVIHFIYFMMEHLYIYNIFIYVAVTLNKYKELKQLIKQTRIEEVKNFVTHKNKSSKNFFIFRMLFQDQKKRERNLRKRK